VLCSRSDYSSWDTTVVEGIRGQVLVENLKRVGGIERDRRTSRSSNPRSTGGPIFRDRAAKVQGGRVREAEPAARDWLWRGDEAQESIGPVELRFGRRRILAGSKAPKLRGIVTFWSSEQKTAMSETAWGHGS
jgi:hypothetical protein